MNHFVSSLKISRVSKLPQIGLRLVNRLHEGHTSENFWLEYIEIIRNPDNFRKLSPQSKCLITCVFTKLDRKLIRETGSHDLIQSIYLDVINDRCISVLNLELINMILVSSYTLRIPLSDIQLELLLSRANEEIRRITNEYRQNEDLEYDQTNSLPVEHLVSIVHSLASLTRYFPIHLNKVRESDLVKSFVNNIELILGLVNAREFSMILFSFDKLNLLTVDNCDKFYRFEQRIKDFDNQSLTTTFYTSANNQNLKQLCDFLIPRINSMISASSYNTRETSDVDRRECVVSNTRSLASPGDNLKILTGRECCNILCSLLRCNSFKEDHYLFLVERMDDMNLQELCNICSLLLSKSYGVGDDFKNTLVNKLVGLTFRNANILDLLTIANSFHIWTIDNEFVLGKMISAITTNGNFVFNDKSVLLLHYLVQLKYYNLNELLKLYNINFDSAKINTRHHIILYNAVNTLKIGLNSGKRRLEEEFEGIDAGNGSIMDSILEKLEDKLISLDFKTLSSLDLLTIAKFCNTKMLEKLTSFLKEDTWNNMEICLKMLKYNSDLQIARSVNALINNVDIDRFFGIISSNGFLPKGELDGEIRRFNHLLSAVVLLNNFSVLKRIVDSAFTTNCSNFEVILNILNSCKKLYYLDDNVNYLLEFLVKSFNSCELFYDLNATTTPDKATHTTNRTNIRSSTHGNKNNCGNNVDINGGVSKPGACNHFSLRPFNIGNDSLYSVQYLISDFVNVLYHFNYYNDSDHYDYGLSRSLGALDIDNIYPLTNESSVNNGLTTPKRNVVGYTDSGNAVVEYKILDDKTLFESLLISLSHLCFNAVVNHSVLTNLIKYHIHKLKICSPTLLKCLTGNVPHSLTHFDLKELTLLNSIKFPVNNRLNKDTDIQTGVLVTLNNLGFNTVAEYQVLDYRIDLLIL